MKKEEYKLENQDCACEKGSVRMFGVPKDKNNTGPKNAAELLKDVKDGLGVVRDSLAEVENTVGWLEAYQSTEDDAPVKEGEKDYYDEDEEEDEEDDDEYWGDEEDDESPLMIAKLTHAGIADGISDALVEVNAALEICTKPLKEQTRTDQIRYLICLEEAQEILEDITVTAKNLKKSIRELDKQAKETEENTCPEGYEEVCAVYRAKGQEGLEKEGLERITVRFKEERSDAWLTVQLTNALAQLCTKMYATDMTDTQWFSKILGVMVDTAMVEMFPLLKGADKKNDK